MDKRGQRILEIVLLVILLILALLITVLLLNPRVTAWEFEDNDDNSDSNDAVKVVIIKEEPEKEPVYFKDLRYRDYDYLKYSDWKKEEDSGRDVVVISNTHGPSRYFSVKFYVRDDGRTRIRTKTEYVRRGDKEEFTCPDSRCDYAVVPGGVGKSYYGDEYDYVKYQYQKERSYQRYHKDGVRIYRDWDDYVDDYWDEDECEDNDYWYWRGCD